MKIPPLYSRTYDRPDKPRDDSPRFRVRLATLFDVFASRHILSEDNLDIALRLRAGIEVPRSDFAGGLLLDDFVRRTKVRNVLDAVGVAYAVIANGRTSQEAGDWAREVNLVFTEEHLAYRMDDDGIVRNRLDDEFEGSVSTLIDGLGDPSVVGVRDSLVKARSHLLGLAADRKAAVRHAYDAVESLAKELTGRSQLDPKTIESVGSLYEKHSDGDAHAANLGRQALGSLKPWHVAFHEYRHGQSPTVVAEPPEDLAIYAVSSAATYVRLLLDLRQRVQSSDGG